MQTIPATIHRKRAIIQRSSHFRDVLEKCGYKGVDLVALSDRQIQFRFDPGMNWSPGITALYKQFADIECVQRGHINSTGDPMIMVTFYPTEGDPEEKDEYPDFEEGPQP